MKSPKKASLQCFIIAWLFLPNAEYAISGLPEYNKISATCYGIVISACIFDRNNLLKWRPKMIDCPIILFCFSPLFSSISNGLGPYDGFSCSLSQTVTWGLPYLIGRFYFCDSKSILKLIEYIVIGGLLYVPLCLIEVRFSPQLHHWVYGYHVADFGQSMRYGGFRPTVFMEHGLMVGMWMATAFMCALVLSQFNNAPAWFKYRKKMILSSLFITLILVKSTGAIFLCALGITCIYTVKIFKTKIFIALLIFMPLFYLFARSFGDWDPQVLVKWAEVTTNRDRAESFAFRIENEEMIVNKAKLRPIFGWGDWGRWRIYDDQGEDVTISDSLWAIIFGRNGYVGIFSLFTFLLLPLIQLLIKCPNTQWFNKKNYPYCILSILCTLYAFDCLLNAMINPFFALCAGAVIAMNPKKIVSLKTNPTSSLKVSTP